MDAADELDAIAGQMQGILDRFEEMWNMGLLGIPEQDKAPFAELVLDARSILSENLGTDSDFVYKLDARTANGPSHEAVSMSVGIVRSGAKAMRRAAAHAAPVRAGAPYVSLDRIQQLRAVPSSPWDLSRLVRMCEELNSVFAAGNYLSTAMVVRAILDHVPPIFGAGTFNEYASSIAGRSVKVSMERLQKSHRIIADRWLHEMIERGRLETLPDGPQVDCRAELSVLLGEVLREVNGKAPAEA